MLAVAGNETTRNSITQGMMAFAEFPEQWELYKKERPETAADEIVRWATPVTSFQRTALEDYELSGVQIKKGQRVLMFYRSANFDEEVFEDPYSFNIMRSPNPHVGFGGTGAHYCIGANLARMTINLIFNAVADHMPDLKPISAAGAAAVGLAQRHQALAGRLHRKMPGGSLMDFDLTATQQAVADVVTSVLDRDLTWEALVDGGVTALPVPERLGGDGVGLPEVGHGADRSGSPRRHHAGAGHAGPRCGAAARPGIRRAAGPFPGRSRQGRRADRRTQRARRGAARPARNHLRRRSVVGHQSRCGDTPNKRTG